MTNEEWRTIDAVPGWLTRLEANMLHDVARDWPGEDRVVEIGSYLGRSTISLAKGLMKRAGPRQRLLAIDTHRGCPEQQAGQQYFEPRAFDPINMGVDTLPWYLRNIESAGVAGWVETWRKDSYMASVEFSGRVRAVFIDGAHDYCSVLGDVLCWLSHLARGGVLMLHDYGDWDGPTQVADLMIRSRILEKVGRADTLLLLCQGKGS